MKTVSKYLILFLISAQTCLGQTRQYGNYFNKWRYWGPMFTLKADSSFDYTIRTNAGTVTITKQDSISTSYITTESYIFKDSSYGTYTIINDTVFFKYATKEIEGNFNGYNGRPAKLLWEGKSLYYIHRVTGAVLRQKEYYLTWSKKRAPNLSGNH